MVYKLFDIKGGDGRQFEGRGDECMLDHLAKTAKDLVRIERLQKSRIDNCFFRRSKESNLILQPLIIKTGLTAGRSVHHAKERGGDIKKRHPAHIGGSCKTAHIGEHTASEVDEKRLSSSPLGDEKLPNKLNRLECFVFLTCRYAAYMFVWNSERLLDDGEAMLTGVGIYEDKHLILGY